VTDQPRATLWKEKTESESNREENLAQLLFRKKTEKKQRHSPVDLSTKKKGTSKSRILMRGPEGEDGVRR